MEEADCRDRAETVSEKAQISLAHSSKSLYHPAFQRFSRWEGEVPEGFVVNFLGVMTRVSFWPPYAAISERYPKGRHVKTEYPPFDEEYFEWIDLLEAITEAEGQFTMLELGGGWGRWVANAAAALRQLGSSARSLIGVEAEPTHFQMMAQHLADNSVDPRCIRLIQAAVAGTDGEVGFHVGETQWGNPANWYGQSIGGATKVKAVSLSTLLKPIGKVDLIDIDVQGAELEVLNKGSEELADKVKRIHVATHDHEIEKGLFLTFGRLGWNCIRYFPSRTTIETKWGTIAFQDGVQTWTNPAYTSETETERPEERAKKWIFDIPWARKFTRTRQAFTAEFLGLVRKQLNLVSALDLGCGVGYFSGFLSNLGFSVIGIDGRAENLWEAKRRYPEINFLVRNVEDQTLPEVGAFDLVLCIGLLYHLENPFRAIRNLHSLTTKVLLIETMCVPGASPTMDLLDEGPSENQGLDYVAFYPSESCVIKMLYRAGFPFVYRFKQLPDDELYRSSPLRKRLRTLVVGSKVALTAPNLALAKEPSRLAWKLAPWSTVLSRLANSFGALGRFVVNANIRLARFVSRPWSQKREILSFYLGAGWNRARLKLRIPEIKRLEPGFLFLVWNDVIRDAVISGDFERAERKFVQRFLRPGMVVLDVGAYHGIYTLTAAIKGASRVIAFEPSPPQRRKLKLNLWLNRCNNVTIEKIALGKTENPGQFFVATGGAEGFSGLQPPAVRAPVQTVSVKVTSVDSYLQNRQIQGVDFVKVDVEGGELDVFKGAQNLLRGKMRPVILCELQDKRTKAWGYTASETAALVQSFGFEWFHALNDGTLEHVPPDADQYDGNFIAVPQERMPEVKDMTK